MKTHALLLTQLMKQTRKKLTLLLLASSFTLSAQTITQTGSVTGESVDGNFNNIIDVIALSSTRVISVAREVNKFEITSWDVALNSIIKKGSTVVLTKIDGVKSTKLTATRFANAYARNGYISIEVWDVSSTGTTFSLKNTQEGNKLYLGSGEINIISLSSSRFITLSVNIDRVLEVITWDVAANGTLTKKATKLIVSEMNNSVEAIALSTSQLVITLTRSGSSPAWVYLYSVNSNGEISHLDDVTFWHHASGFRLAPVKADMFVYASTDEVDQSLDNVFSWKIGADNKLVQLQSKHSVIANEGVITRLNSTNILTAGIKNSNSSICLNHFKIGSDGAFTHKYERVSEVTKQIRATMLFANASNSRVVIASINNNNKLRLLSWDIALNTARPETTTDIENEEVVSADINAYPNPAANRTTFRFYLNENAPVSLKIYNSIGELVKEVTNENFSQGSHEIECSVETIPAGIYYYSFETKEKRIMNKLVIAH